MIGRGIFHSRHSPLQMRCVGCAVGLVVACRSSCEKVHLLRLATVSLRLAAVSLRHAVPPADIPDGCSFNLAPTGEGVSYGIYAVRDMSRYTRALGRTAAGYARCPEQREAEGLAVQLITYDVVRRMRRAGQGDRADWLERGAMPGGPRLPPLRSSRWRCPHYYPSRLSR